MKTRDWQIITIISDSEYEEVDCNSGDRRRMHNGWTCWNRGEEKPSSASYHAREDAQAYAMKLMVEHLHDVHGFGPRKIGKLMGLKYTLVEKMLSPNTPKTKPPTEPQSFRQQTLHYV